MKRLLKTVSVVTFAMAGVLVAQAARADESVIARIPFAFVVNGVELPAGDYVVSRDTRQPELIAISTADGERRTLTLSRAGDGDKNRPEQPKLEFERVGKQVHLSQVTLGSGNTREIAYPAAGEEAPRK